MNPPLYQGDPYARRFDGSVGLEITSSHPIRVVTFEGGPEITIESVGTTDVYEFDSVDLDGFTWPTLRIKP